MTLEDILLFRMRNLSHKSWWFLMLSTQLVLSLSVHAHEFPPRPLVVRIGTDGKKAYDPKNHGQVLITFSNAVLGRLIDFSSTQQIVSSLLSKFYWDYKTQRFYLTLAPGLRFHNGRQVTIEDLEFSLVRFFLTKKRADQVAALKNIEGVENLKRGSRYVPWSVSGIQRAGLNSLTIKLKSTDFTFPYCFRDGWLSLVPREELQPDYVTWRRYPIGAGPYAVENVSEFPHRILLSRVKNSRSDAPEKILLVMDTEIPADLALFESASKKTEGLTQILGESPASYVGIFFNPKNRLAQNLEFRKALSSLFDLKAWVQAHPKESKLLAEPLPSNFGGRIGVNAPINFAQARLHLTNVPRSLLRRQLKAAYFTGVSLEDPEEKAFRKILSDQLTQAGLRTSFIQNESPTFSTHDAETVFKVDVRGTHVVDPLILFRAYEAPGLLSRLFVGPKKKLSHLLRECEAQPNLEMRMKSMKKLTSLFFNHRIVIPLFERKPSYFINPQRVFSVGQQHGIGFDLINLIVQRKNSLQAEAAE